MAEHVTIHIKAEQLHEEGRDKNIHATSDLWHPSRYSSAQAFSHRRSNSRQKQVAGVLGQVCLFQTDQLSRERGKSSLVANLWSPWFALPGPVTLTKSSTSLGLSFLIGAREEGEPTSSGGLEAPCPAQPGHPFPGHYI